MSDNLEKFVLQYTVELKDTISRLEELQEKMDDVKKSGKSGGDDIKGVFKDLKNEVAPLRNEFGAIDGIIARLGYRIAWLAPLMAGLALTVKSIVDVRKEYEAQRQLGFESGMTPIAIEQFQREANKASGGVVGAEGARGIVQKTSNLAFASYTNPDVMSRESIILNKLGTSAFNPQGGIKETRQILDEIGNKMASVSKEQATAIGMLAGFSADEVKALRNRSQALKEGEKISDNELNRLRQQQQALETVRNAMGSIQEDWRRIELIVGEAILPIFSDLVKKAADFAEESRNMWQTLADGWDDFVERFMFDLKNPFATQQEKQQAYTERFMNQVMRDQQRQTEKNLREQDRGAQETRNAQAMFTRDINLFSTAVSTFAGVIDERQAWAAWAGEIGRAAGVSAAQGTTALPTGATESSSFGPVNPSIYDQIYQEQADKYKDLGMTPDLLKAITKVESGFQPNAISEVGATGLMQIMPSNFKGLGITDAFDPRQNIAGGAQLMAEYLRAAKGDLRTALTMYHGGYDRSGWGPRTRAYADKVFAALGTVQQSQAQPAIPASIPSPSVDNRGQYASANDTRPPGAPPIPVMSGNRYDRVEAQRGHTAPVQGQSRESLQLRGIQEAVAGYLGVPVQQLMQGRVNRGDVDFARQYLAVGTERELVKNQMLAVTPGVRPNIAAEAAKNARELAFQLNAFQKFGQTLSDKSQAGGRSITVGQKGVAFGPDDLANIQKEINIFVNGAQDPAAIGREIQGILRGDDINDINNLTASPTKW